MLSRPELTITVVSWNTLKLLRSCLHSIERSDAKRSIEVHVVDNASIDGSAEMVKEEYPQALLISNQENLGFAKANNQSWSQAKGRYWLLLNSDAELHPGAIDALIGFMDQHPRAGLATARLVSPDGSPQHCAQSNPSIWRTLAESLRLHKLLPAKLRGRIWQGPYWTYDETMRVGWTWGTALIARREAVEQVGPLSEEFFMYGEDLEWCLRMRRAGWEIWFCAEAEVLHYGGQSSAQRWNDAAKMKIIFDNTYKAISMHRGRFYVRALQVATLTALAFEWLTMRLRKRPAHTLSRVLAYHLQVLKGA